MRSDREGTARRAANAPAASPAPTSAVLSYGSEAAAKGLGRTTPAVFDPFHPLGQPQPRLCGQQPHLARVLAPGPLCLAHGGTPTVPILP